MLGRSLMIWYIIGWVKLRLLEKVRWLILFVVAISSVPDDVDENVFVEELPVLHSELHNFINHFWFIGVHVEDGGLNSFCHICTIQACSSFSRSCSKPDLVVGNYMDDSVSLVMVQVRHLKTFIHYSLTGKSCISMDYDAHRIHVFMTV